MEKENCFHLGRISRHHGVKGEVSIYLDVDDPSQYKKLESVYVEINRKLVPFFISQIRITQKNFAIVKFRDILTYEQATDLIAKELYLPLEFLPEPAQNAFYIHDVIGYTLVDEDRGELGKISDVFDYPSNRLVQVFINNREVLLPFNEQTIISIDKEKQTLLIRTAAGLIDLYLTDDHARED